MNDAEMRTYQWLLNHGYEATEIEFQPNRSPDFLTLDGGGFEAKAPTPDRCIYFEPAQMRSLVGTTVIIQDFDGDSTVVPFDTLSIPGRLGRYRLRVRHPSMSHTSVDIPKALHRKVVVKLARDAKSLREVIQEALEAYAGARA